jgi:NitT/TauT family transport system substrate-binding protein
MVRFLLVFDAIKVWRTPVTRHAAPAPTSLRRTVFSAVTSALLGLAASESDTGPSLAQAPVPAKLTTGFIFTGGSAAPLLYAEKHGYFTQGGVQIDIVRGFGSADVVAKVAAGTYEAGTGYFPELLRAKAENPTLDAIAVAIAYDSGPDGLVGQKSNGMVKPQDVAGKRIAAQPGNTSMLTFPIFAKAMGIDPSSVKWVSVGFPLIAVTVQQGNADLAAGFVSTSIASFEKLGLADSQLVPFSYSDYIGHLYGNALIMRKSWIEAHPDAAKGLVRAYVRGLIETRDHQEESMNLLMAREPLLNRAAETKDLAYSLTKYYFTERVLKGGFGYQTTADVDTFIKQLVEPMGLKRVPTADEIYTAALLPPPAERAVPH